MECVIDFPGGLRVDAHFGTNAVRADQPTAEGGQALAPTPFATFLAALGACAGYYVLTFCRQRQLPRRGLRLIQRAAADPSTHLVTRVTFEIQPPPDFPE